MRMQRVFWFALLSLVSGLHSIGTPLVAGEDRVQMLSACTVRVLSGQERSSGVLISDQGHVLTVAHGLVANSTAAEVVLCGGHKLTATIVFRDPERDLALLRLMPEDQKTVDFSGYAKVRTEPIRPSELLIAAGFPGREETASVPVLRMGVCRTIENGILKSTCVLTAGDSGGPVFDRFGRLAGLHQRIGLTVDTNLHTSIHTIMGSIAGHVAFTEAPATHDLWPELADDGTIDQNASHVTVLSLHAELPDSERIAYGTLVLTDRIATKLSLVQTATVLYGRSADIAPLELKVVRTDRLNDLAILAPVVGSTLELPREIEEPGPSARMGDVVSVAGVSRLSARPGIISRADHQEPPSSVRLGVVVVEIEERIQVRSVTAGSAAAISGVRSGDTILRINDLAIGKTDDVVKSLDGFQPGDFVSLDIARGSESLRITLLLQDDPSTRFARTEFLDGRAGELSLRRTGFSEVIQHDLPLLPTEMGSPIVNTRHELPGINIARRSRESTLALPMSLVRALAVMPPEQNVP